VVELGRWSTPPIFGEIQRLGAIEDDEMARVFNLGIGLVLVVAAGDGHAALEALKEAGKDATVVGRIVEGTGQVRIIDGPS
jgi:phosphoribosylformylglycinamidine cyclo-ligase